MDFSKFYKYFKQKSLSEAEYGEDENLSKSDVFFEKRSFHTKKSKRTRKSYRFINDSPNPDEYINKQIIYVTIKSFKNYYIRNNIENILDKKKAIKKLALQNKKRNNLVIFFIFRMEIKKLIRQIKFAKKIRSNLKRNDFELIPKVIKKKRALTYFVSDKSKTILNQKTHKY